MAYHVVNFDKYAKNHIAGYKALDNVTHAIFVYQSVKELPDRFCGEDYYENLCRVTDEYRKVASDPSIIEDSH